MDGNVVLGVIQFSFSFAFSEQMKNQKNNHDLIIICHELKSILNAMAHKVRREVSVPMHIENVHSMHIHNIFFFPIIRQSVSTEKTKS